MIDAAPVLPANPMIARWLTGKDIISLPGNPLTQVEPKGGRHLIVWAFGKRLRKEACTLAWFARHAEARCDVFLQLPGARHAPEIPVLLAQRQPTGTGGQDGIAVLLVTGPDLIEPRPVPGVSRSVGKKLTGHKTDSVYDRYAIVSKSDLEDAARRLDILNEANPNKEVSKFPR